MAGPVALHDAVPAELTFLGGREGVGGHAGLDAAIWLICAGLGDDVQAKPRGGDRVLAVIETDHSEGNWHPNFEYERRRGDRVVMLPIGADEAHAAWQYVNRVMLVGHASEGGFHSRRGPWGIVGQGRLRHDGKAQAQSSARGKKCFHMINFLVNFSVVRWKSTRLVYYNIKVLQRSAWSIFGNWMIFHEIAPLDQNAVGVFQFPVFGSVTTGTAATEIFAPLEAAFCSA